MPQYAAKFLFVILLTCPLLVAVVARAAPAPVAKPRPSHPTTRDWERLLGDWKRVSYECDGGSGGSTALIIRISRQGIVYTDERMLDNPRYPLVIDASKKPKRWDVSNEVGIYILEDDTLTICTTNSETETDRPTAFTTEENSGRHLQVFNRMPR